jgi:hypothetical protein
MNRDEFIMLQTHPLNQRVFVVGNNSLFEEGVSHLLTLEIGLQVSSIKYTDDLTLMAHIATHRPQVIILNESSLADPLCLLDRLCDVPWLMGVCIIIMRLADNIIDVYDVSPNLDVRRLVERQQFTLSKRDDLVAVVRG